MSKEPKVESILWSTANVVKAATFVGTIMIAVYSVIHNQDQKNAELMTEIQSLREDLNVYIAEAKGKNDVQDLQFTQHTNDINDLQDKFAEIVEQFAIKPEQIRVPNKGKR